jgi:IPT/TIG domain
MAGARFVPRTLVGTVGALLLAACGPGDATPTTDETESIGNPDAPTTASLDPRAAEPATVQWLPFGPAAPSSAAARERWYAYLALEDCTTVAREAATGYYGGPPGAEAATRALYRGAANACLGVRTGDKRAWAEAVEALPVAKGGGHTECLDDAVLAVLDQLVNVHVDRPDRLIQLIDAPPSTTACPFAVGSAQPDRGGMQGGTAVVITGTNLSATLIDRILFGDVSVVAVSDRPAPAGGTGVAVTSPQSPAGPATVPVVVVMKTGERYEVSGGYTYVEEAGPAEEGPEGGPD